MSEAWIESEGESSLGGESGEQPVQQLEELLASFETAPGSKLGASVLSGIPSSPQEDHLTDDFLAPEVTTQNTTTTTTAKRGRGRPKGKQATKRSTPAVTTNAVATAQRKAAEVYELEEAATELNLTSQSAWQKEKEETIDKLSSKAIRDLDIQIKQAKKQQADAMKEAVEFGYEADMSKEEWTAKNSLLKKIQMYYHHYPQLRETNERRGKWSAKTSFKDLQDEVNRCDSQLSLDRSYLTMCSIDLFNNYLAEIVLRQGFGVPAHGLAAEAKKSQMVVEDELKELSIKYHDWLETGPEVRYMIKFANRVSRVIERNHEIIKHGAPLEPAEEDVNFQNKYGDM
jgi:hypothetical protein